jgi:hypothetical protein
MVFRVALAAVGFLALLASYPAAQPKFSDWSAPVNLGPVVNSAFVDAQPAISKRGSSLYFNSNRPGGEGQNDIWVSQWDSGDQSWGSPVNLGPVINTAGTEAGPVLSRDEHWLFFHSDRPGGFGGLDVWVSYREHIHNDFGWQPPVNLGPGVNSAFFDTAGGYFENDDAGVPQFFFGSNRPPGPSFNFYVSDLLPDGTFGPATLIQELSSPMADPGLMVAFHGLEAFFFSNRPGGSGGQDVWTATRKTAFDLWSAPLNLGPLVNSSGIDQRPYIASDLRTLYFASDRDGGFGGLDMYVTTRSRASKP